MVKDFSPFYEAIKAQRLREEREEEEYHEKRFRESLRHREIEDM